MIYFCVFVLFVAFAKMIHDIIKTNVFTYVLVEDPEYYEPRRSLLDKIGKDYRYFAKVKYKDKTVNVGLSKEMWEQKETVTPLLVLRKGIPYCLIYQQTEM